MTVTSLFLVRSSAFGRGPYISLFGGFKHHLFGLALGGGDILRGNIGSPVWVDRCAPKERFLRLWP